MSISVEIIGVPELNRVFETLRKGQANKITGPAIRKAASVGAKKVKAAIPSRYKGVRAAIGWRPLKTKYNGGMVGAKVGAGVGKRTTAKSAKQEATTVKRRGTRKGVGFDARNIHWWFLGTDERMTGTKRKRVGGKKGRGGWKGKTIRVDTGGVKKRTGRMPPQERPISVLLSRHANEINNVIRTWIDVGLKKEVDRIAKKRSI